MEASAKFLILRRHTYRAGILVAFTHHDAAQYNQSAGCKTELFGTQHRHQHDVTTGFQLSVHLQHHLPAQTVQYKGLLRFTQSQFRRDTGIADTGGRRSPRASFRTGDDNKVGFCFGHSGCNGSYAAFSYQFHTDLGTGIYILQVEDQLCQVLNRINVVMGRGRNQ